MSSNGSNASLTTASIVVACCASLVWWSNNLQGLGRACGLWVAANMVAMRAQVELAGYVSSLVACGLQLHRKMYKALNLVVASYGSSMMAKLQRQCVELQKVLYMVQRQPIWSRMELVAYASSDRIHGTMC